MIYSTTFLTLDGVMADPHVWHPAYAIREAAYRSLPRRRIGGRRHVV
jgi:hypothetical protein